MSPNDTWTLVPRIWVGNKLSPLSQPFVTSTVNVTKSVSVTAACHRRCQCQHECQCQCQGQCILKRHQHFCNKLLLSSTWLSIKMPHTVMQYAITHMLPHATSMLINHLSHATSMPLHKTTICSTQASHSNSHNGTFFFMPEPTMTTLKLRKRPPCSLKLLFKLFLITIIIMQKKNTFHKGCFYEKQGNGKYIVSLHFSPFIHIQHYLKSIYGMTITWKVNEQA